MVDQVQHRRNHGRARDDTEDQRDLLFPRSCFDQLTGFEILQIVVRDRGDVKNHGGREERESHQRLARIRPDVRLHADDQEERRADYHENPDAGERTV